MEKAIEEAQRSLKNSEVPVGAVIAKNDKIIAKAYNRIETENDATAHAEILAIRKAGRKTGNWRLSDSTLYVTVEPCAMCLTAIHLARIKKIVFGCASFNKMYTNRSLKKPELVQIPDITIQEKCSKMMKDFFKKARNARRIK